MLISKRKVINALFLVGFTFYGVGSYVSVKQNFSSGIIFSIIPFVAILLFYLFDLIYRKQFTPMVNSVYALGMLYLVSLVGTVWVGLSWGFPGLNPLNTTTISINYIVPFSAMVVVQVYNRDNEDFNWSLVILKSLLLLILVNLIGYGSGLHNMVHSFEGRFSPPFLTGIYDAAHILAIINLMLIFYIKDFIGRPFRFLLLSGLFVFNMALMLNVNSRLSLMIFMVLLVLFVTRALKAAKGLYTISLFTMPILMSFSLLVYEVMSIPFIKEIVGRVSKKDVTTFNGRTYLWEGVWDWFIDDRRGLMFGNGHLGQYKVGMLNFMKKLWEGDVANIHLHSTFLEILVDQGLFGLILYYILMYKGFKYYRTQYLQRTQEAPLFAAFVYLMFIWQIDIFCFGLNVGNPIVFALLALIAIHPKWITRKQKDLHGNVISTTEVA